ncbi:MAG: AAA family ATPase, partial [bacterium]|nr:AAA family ATPase [bacterium]
MKDLFDHARDQRKTGFSPLADRMRPTHFEDLLGQEELVGVDKPLRLLIERDQIPSMIFWGPPGTGKTTLAKIVAEHTKAVFMELSAVMSGVADMRRVIKEADERQKFHAQRTILFIDEIH